jgi:C1A family cysteine protease
MREYLNLNDMIANINKRAKILPKMQVIEQKYLITKKNSILKFNNTLKPYSSIVYDQGSIGSCTANAFCSSFNIDNFIKKKYNNFLPSRLYLYYKERLIIGTEDIDSGANVIDGSTYVKKNGICSEPLWPYIEKKFAIEPPTECDINAINYKIKNYVIIPRDKNLITNIKRCINNKLSVLIAVAIYDSFVSFDTSRTGLIQIPNFKKERLIGGHQMCIIGYDDIRQLFIVQNSWGTKWGDKGFCYVPYKYLTNPNLGFEFCYIML